jgi:hypothetical protein
MVTTMMADAAGGIWLVVDNFAFVGFLFLYLAL